VKNNQYVLSDEQVRALNSAVRQEIFFGLIQIEEASVSELAAHTGRTPKSLYHHLRHLSDSGLIIQVSTRKSGARMEAIYAPISADVRIPRNEATIDGVTSIMRLTARDQIRAFDNPSEDSCVLMRIGLKLTASDQQVLRSKLRELSEWTQSRSNPEGRRISLTIAFAPLEVEQS